MDVMFNKALFQLQVIFLTWAQLISYKIVLQPALVPLQPTKCSSKTD